MGSIWAQTPLLWISRPDSGFDTLGKGGKPAAGDGHHCHRDGGMALGGSSRRGASSTASGFINNNTKQLKTSNESTTKNFTPTKLDLALKGLHIATTTTFNEPPSLTTSIASSANSSKYQSSNPSSPLSSPGGLDIFDGIAFRKRLFTRNYVNCVGLDEELSIVPRDFWMSVQLTDALFVEVGHGAMAMGKDKFVDLIDETYDNDTTNQLIVYFSKERSDFRQLIDSFLIMDFTPITVLKLSADIGYDLNDSNYFMKVSTDMDDSDDACDSCDDLIAFD